MTISNACLALEVADGNRGRKFVLCDSEVEN